MQADPNKPSRGATLIPFLFLIYLTSPIIVLLQEPPLVQVTGFILVALFAVSYIHGFLVEKYRLPQIFVLLAVTVYLSLTSDPYMILMGFFSAGVISQLRSPWQFWTATCAEFAAFAAVLLLADRSFLADNWYSMLPPFIIILCFPFGLRIVQRSRLLKQKLSFANEEIARLSIVEERQRISRDLHDTLGHTLSLITLKSELAEKLLAKAPEKAAGEIRDIQNTARTALRQVRELVADMSAITVKDELLNTRQILQAAGIDYTIHGGDLTDAPPLTQNIMGLCLKEAVNNVVKHSGASFCEITLSQSGREWRLSVADSGQAKEEEDVRRVKANSGQVKANSEQAQANSGQVKANDGQAQTNGGRVKKNGEQAQANGGRVKEHDSGKNAAGHKDWGSEGPADLDPRTPPVSTGQGLIGMQDRLKLIQGTLAFTSNRDLGSTLVISVPKVIKDTEGK